MAEYLEAATDTNRSTGDPISRPFAGHIAIPCARLLFHFYCESGHSYFLHDYATNPLLVWVYKYRESVCEIGQNSSSHY